MRFTIIAMFLACFVATFAAGHIEFADKKVCKGKGFLACLPCCKKHGYKEDFGVLAFRKFDCICGTDHAKPSERVLTVVRDEREELYGKDYYRKYE